MRALRVRDNDELRDDLDDLPKVGTFESEKVRRAAVRETERRRPPVTLLVTERKLRKIGCRPTVRVGVLLRPKADWPIRTDDGIRLTERLRLLPKLREKLRCDMPEPPR